MALKYQMVADDLRMQIRGGKYVNAPALSTEFDIAREYQVSRQTVRQALSVLVQEGLIEKRQGSGSRILRREESGRGRYATVAVVMTYISDYIFPSILREVERVLSEHGCTPLLFSTRNQVDNERKILTDLLTMPISGVLVEGSKTVLPNPNLDLYQKFIDGGVPLVFIHATYSNLPYVLSVLDDNYNGGRMLVEYLREKGHTHIAGIFKNDDLQGLQRYEGYTAALRDLGLPLDDRRVFWYNTGLKERLLNGAPMDEVFRALEGCTAVVCYNDEIANRLVAELVRRGIKIPGEMAVVSFDNSRYSDLSPIPITSLSHGEANVGRMAAELLVKQLHGEAGASQKAPWVLIEKASS